MDSERIAAMLAEIRVVPVVSIDRAADSPGLAGALAAGGLPLVEVTFRTPAAADAIAAIRAARTDVTVGAGTVLDAATVDRALDAGAEFIVAPGFNPAVVEHCMERGIAVIPGVVTPSEIERALAAGIGLVKFFPAEAAGGVAYLRAVSAPYRDVRFIPTGGVSQANLADYLDLPSVTACGGTWIAPAADIRDHRWEAIAAAATAAVSVAATARR